MRRGAVILVRLILFFVVRRILIHPFVNTVTHPVAESERIFAMVYVAGSGILIGVLEEDTSIPAMNVLLVLNSGYLVFLGQ